jgi:ATP-dependent Zn protease
MLEYDGWLPGSLPSDRNDTFQIARHEAANAAIGLLVAETKLETISLCVPGAEGVTHFASIPEQPITRRHFEALILVYLAGRAADDVFHEVDAESRGGPGSDLALARPLCASIHRAHGLRDKIRSFGSPDSAIASLRDPDFRKIVEADLQRLYVRAKAMVVERKADIEHVAREFVRRRFLSADEVEDILTRTARSRVPSGRVPTGGRNG